MRKSMFQIGTIIHDGSGKVGKILLSKEGKRQYAQLLGKRNTPIGTFLIYRSIGVAKLQNGKAVHQHHKADAEQSIIKKSTNRRHFRIKCRTQIIIQKEENKHCRQHQSNIQQNSKKYPFTEILRTFFRKSKTLLNRIKHE